MDFSAWKPSDLLAAISLVLAILGVIAGLLYRLLDDPDDRKTIGRWLECTAILDKYKSGVLWGLGKLQGYYGTPFSYRAFNRSVSLAIAYSIFLFSLAWALDGPRGIAHFQLPADWEDWQRYLMLAALITFFAGVVGFIQISERLASHILGQWGLPGKWADIVHVILITALVSSAFGAFVVVGKFGSSFTVIFMVMGIAVVAIKLERIFTILFTALIWGVLLLLFGALGEGTAFHGVREGTTAARDFYNGALLLLFIFVLPAVNGFADYISLGVSRKLLSSGHSPGKLARHVCYDTVLAFIFLVALATLLLVAMTGLEKTVHSEPALKFDWEPYVDAARRNAWSSGLMVTLMLCSTLVPTIAHLLIASIGLVLEPLPFRRSVAALLTTGSAPRTSHKIAAVAYLMTGAVAGLAGLSAALCGIWWLIDFLTDETVGGHVDGITTWAARLLY